MAVDILWLLARIFCRFLFFNFVLNFLGLLFIQIYLFLQFCNLDCPPQSKLRIFFWFQVFYPLFLCLTFLLNL